MFGGGKKKKAEDLMANGHKAVGTVTNVQDTGMTMNDDPRVKMTFLVEPLDGAPSFEAAKTKTVSRVQIPQSGQRYPVWFDPDDHESWAYAVIDAPEGRAQIAAMFGDAFGPDASGVGMPAAAAAPAAAPAAADPLEKIRKLDELRQAGALTDEEFAAQKAKLLEQL